MDLHENSKGVTVFQVFLSLPGPEPGFGGLAHHDRPACGRVSGSSGRPYPPVGPSRSTRLESDQGSEFTHLRDDDLVPLPHARADDPNR